MKEKRVKKYVILQSGSAIGLQDLVNQAMDDGHELIGGLVIVLDETLTFSQAMINTHAIEMVDDTGK